MDEIKTEVDRLIELMQNSKGRKMRLSELASLSGLSISQARKWIHVLEERGQVKVRYRFADEEVEWVSPKTQTLGQRVVQHSAGANANVEAAHFIEERFRQAYKQQTEASRNIEDAHELAEEIKGPEKQIGQQEKESQKEAESPKTQLQSQSTPASQIQPLQELQGKIPPSFSKTYQPPYSKMKARQKQAEPISPILPPMPKLNEKALKMSQTLKNKLAEIKAKREEIESLKAEKKKMLVEVYHPMETRFEEEVGAITEKLIELENRLLAIRQEAAKIPQDIAELSGEQERIIQVALEMQRLYEDTNSQMTHLMQTIKDARAEALEKIEATRAAMSEEASRLEQLNMYSAQLQELQAEIEQKLSQIKEMMEKQAMQLKASEDEMQMVGKLREQIHASWVAGAEEIEKEKEALSQMERQLARLDEVQHWAQAHQLEYNERMKKLNQYILESEKRYNELKAAIDTGYVHKYLRDLRALSESYEFELSQAQQLEANIDQKIEETKKELASLIAQAREIADAHEMQLGQALDVQALIKENANQEEKAIGPLLEQQEDRKRLRESIKKAIAGEEDLQKGEHQGNAGPAGKEGEEESKVQIVEIMPAKEEKKAKKEAAKLKKKKPKNKEKEKQ
jgi:hypothetical protein